jgi:Na+/H+-dicarboxylate symporter
MLKSLPVQLVLCLIVAFVVGDYFNIELIRWAFTISCLLKEILMTVLPVVIFSYIFAAMLSFEKKAPLLIICILSMVVLSNGTAALLSYSAGLLALPYLITADSAHLSNMAIDVITPVFNISIPKLIAPDKTLILGVTAGLIFSFLNKPKINKFALKFREKVTVVLQKWFIPFLPLYVFGFVLKMHHEGVLTMLFKNYGQVFLLGCLLIILYLSALYFIASHFNYKKFLGYIKEMMPAGLTGFSTMSSAATMPFTLNATEKNLEDREYADLVIPSTVNIHLIGDSLMIPLTALSILLLSGHALPSLEHYLIFVGYYCLAKFSCAAIPGGGVIVIIPVVQSHLGLSAEMSSLLATLYILQDPIFTMSNVMGNGVFAILSQKICRAIGVLRPKAS